MAYSGRFAENTRLKFQQGSVMTRPTGGGITQIELPKAGLLGAIVLPISVTIAGSLSAPNAYGLASVIKRIQLKVNAGQTIYDISGAGYFYLLSQEINDNYDMRQYTDAYSAVTTGTKNLSMFLPISSNIRDEIGLIMLQNMQTIVTLSIEWEADATVATGATITGTASPMYWIYEVPSNPDDIPELNTIHQVLEETISITGAIDYDHQIPIGATVIGQYYLFPAGFTRARLILQNSNVVYDVNVEQHRMVYLATTGRDLLLAGALTGVDKRIFWDLCGTDGLGQFGSVRDVIDTQSLTSILTRITTVGSGTLSAVRRQIVNLSQ